MGFDWLVNVSVSYVQEVEYIDCFSRLGTRCLKLRDPNNKLKKPGEPMPEEMRLDNDEPFSEDEDDLKVLKANNHLNIYQNIKKKMDGNHACENEITCFTDGEELINKCFQIAAERIIPGSGSKFALRFETHGGAHGETDEGAKYEFAYIEYLPAFCSADGGLDVGRGGINVPWGMKLTPVTVLDHDEKTQVNAAFAVLLEKLGLVKVGEPGLKLVSSSSGG